ncbi:MAG: helix-turn-helix transcriptional regulator [Pseudomonadota bacterium]
MSAAKTPNPIDVHVGSRVRLRRTMMSMSQEKLGDALGVTFQQVQKYEKGTNRIGASRMQQICNVLEAPVSFFFEDAPGDVSGQAAGMSEPGADFVVDFLSTSEGVQLNKAFARVKDPAVRKRIVDLVKTLADQAESS